ncbi:MAG: hypothetical protein GY859_29785, partial [Desulfobacterales bacterium]|nr:hypothetical protein [Desulfobacterales bacterium]
MGLKEALFTKTGPAVAKAVIGRLFPEPISRAAATSIFDLLLGKWQDFAAASKGEIHFKKLANDVAERLLPAFQSR